jgi:hypothetical protein
MKKGWLFFWDKCFQKNPPKGLKKLYTYQDKKDGYILGHINFKTSPPYVSHKKYGSD